MNIQTGINMKKILLLFALFSCEKQEPKVNCYNCTAGVEVNHHTTFKKWRECGISAEIIENYHNRPYINGNAVRSKCFLEK